MTYTATISSKGQITLPVKLRRELQLNKKVTIDFDKKSGEAILKKPPTMADAWALLDESSEQTQLSEREQLLSDHFSKKDRQKRGY